MSADFHLQCNGKDFKMLKAHAKTIFEWRKWGRGKISVQTISLATKTSVVSVEGIRSK